MNVIPPQTASLETALQQATAHHQAGRLQEAEKLYRSILLVQPGHPDANHNMGILAGQTGQHTLVLPLLKTALDANPSQGQYWLSYASALLASGQAAEALNTLQTAIQRGLDTPAAKSLLQKAQTAARKTLATGNTPTPAELNQLVALFNAGRHAELESRARSLLQHFQNSGFTWKVLGASLQIQGKDALPAMQKAAEFLPNDAEVHNNLAVALKNIGRLDDAVANFRKALNIQPNFPGAHNNLGNTLKNLGQLDAAMKSYRRALEIKPDYAEAHNNLGLVLQDIGQHEDAITSYRLALKIKPDFAEAHGNLGLALQDIGKHDDAIASFRRALEIKPDYAEVYGNLANILGDIGQHDGAVANYRRALEIKPDFAEMHGNLGIALHDLGQLDAAVESFQRAHQIQPQFFQHAINAHLLLPIIPDSTNTISIWRQRYQAGIVALMSIPGLLEEPPRDMNSLSFYLAYHNQDDRPAMEALCRLFRALVPGLTVTAPHINNWRPPAARGQRMRVGFLSEYLTGHTIGKLYQGLIRHLDRDHFEVVIFHAHETRHDSFSNDLDSLADRTIVLPATLKNQQQAIMAEELDVLFYPDIGMAPSTYFLAFARLAPVQAVSWGHPDTTGLDTMDYFVSSDFIEPDAAEEHYTERLVRLSRLPCFYQPLIAPVQISDRTALGLPVTGTLYGCPQSLFKFHPDFDAVLAAIAEGDPTGHIVLLEGKSHSWTDLLKARWKNRFPALAGRVIFLPRMPLERFMALMAHIDVLLDPVHFGSGNTLYEGMVYGTPVVTWPGRFMRGQIMAGAYRQMGINDAPIARSLEEYAPLALALGRDPERRSALRQASLEAANKELFADIHAVREFEAFLEAAISAAACGEKLLPGWKPNNPVPSQSFT